MTLLRTKWS